MGTMTNNVSIESELKDLLLNEIKEMYWVERRINVLLPKMQHHIFSMRLRTLFEKEKQQVSEHIDQLEQGFIMMNEVPQEQACQISHELFQQANIFVGMEEEFTVLHDLELILIYQEIMSYEIISYSGMVQMSQSLNFLELQMIFERILCECRITNDNLVFNAR